MRGEIMIEVENLREYALKWQTTPQFASRSLEMNVTIRRAKVSDAQRIQAMHHRLSRESVFSRYLRPYKPTLEDLQDVCSFGEEEGFVLIATIEEPEEKVIGISYYCVEPQNPTSAEPAILVEDEFQGRGLGKGLLKKLCQHANILGVTEFICYAHPANRRVFSIVERSGMRFESKYDEGMNEIRVWLYPNS
jgi:RimJ/RimL family protein N-acetyltransferase